MRIRLFFPSIALFWIIMNVLLWRAEFGGGREGDSDVSADVVWRKILTAPDDSPLEIRYQGKTIGYCRWVPSVGEARGAAKAATDEFRPEGMIRQLGGYTIDMEGNLLFADRAARMRFSARAQISTNHVWEEIFLRLALRPAFWEARAVVAEKNVSLKYEDDVEKWSRNFTFDQLQNPSRLVEEFGGPLTLALMAPLQGIENTKNSKDPALDLGLKWEARNDALKIGHSTVRVYRLQARLVDRYQIVVIVSRVGEIMRVELPNGVLLVNEATNL